jgi:hypothetical protein
VAGAADRWGGQALDCHRLSGDGQSVVKAPLTRYRGETASVFDLLGSNENDLTAALGWSLHRCPTLLTLLWKRLGQTTDGADVDVALEVADSLGRTDLELTTRRSAVIIEAKKGWLLPEASQLALYSPRLEAFENGLLVTLSDSSAEWASQVLPATIDSYEVVHLPWDRVRDDIRAARGTAGTIEKIWLNELTTYLAGATSVRSPSDQ